MSASPTAIFEKSISYDRQSRDFRAELDGILVGYFGSYHAAEIALDQAAYDRLTDDDTPPEPTDVNWNSACPECAGAGIIASNGCTGDACGGWAETCPDCRGTGHASPSDPPPDDFPGEDIDGVPYPAHIGYGEVR